MNALLDEKRTARLEIGLPWMKQLRVSPTVEAVLLEEKPASVTWGDFAILAMVLFCFIARIVRGDVRGVIRLGVRLAGSTPDAGQVDPTPGRSPDARQDGLRP